MEDIAVEDGESAWPHPHPSIKRQILLKRDIQYEVHMTLIRHLFTEYQITVTSYMTICGW